MKLEMDTFLPTLPVPLADSDGPGHVRELQIVAMKASLTEMFGDAAYRVAVGQPRTADVSGVSGISWGDLAEAFTNN